MKIVFIVLLSFVFSHDISLEEAEIVALNAFEEKNNLEEDFFISSIIKYPNIENPSIYIFNLNDEGYILVSSEDRVIPILGFSFSGHFNVNNIPYQLQDLLNYYINQIEYVKTSNFVSDVEISSKWFHYLQKEFIPEREHRDVEPMLETNWNQDNGYNSMCPSSNNQNALVGCTAIGMGQIMKYWEYPNQGSSYFSYTDPVVYDNIYYGLQEADFGNTIYEWDQMENNYATDATSLLLFHAGVATGMDYGPSFSGAWVGTDCDVWGNWENSCIYQIENSSFYTCEILENIDGYGPSSSTCEYDAQCGFCEDSFMDDTNYFFPNALDGLKQFFGYNPDATYVYKEFWDTNLQYISDSEWVNILKDQLDQGYPVIHVGYTEYGGHTWNIDGYSDDYFHNNWGWGGSGNGYYLINDLTPLGSLPFSYYRSAILDLFPGSSWTIGDINNDSIIDILDVVMLINFILNIENPNYSEFNSADYNDDNIINIQDLILIIHLILNN